MRYALTVLAIVLGLVVVFAAFRNASPPAPEQPTEQAAAPETAPTAPAETPEGPAAAPEASTEAEPEPQRGPGADATAAARRAATDPTAAGAAAPATAPPTPLGELRVLPAENPAPASLGSADPDSGYLARADLVQYGAGVWRIALAEYRQTVVGDEPYVVERVLNVPNPGGRPAEITVYPYAARSVTLNGQRVDLQQVAWSRGELTESEAGASVDYRVVIADAEGAPVAEIIRRYTLSRASYSLRLRQRIINRTAAPLEVVWEQNAQSDLPLDDASYMGDQRLVVTGYFNLDYDPRRTSVYTEDGFVSRADVLEAGDVWPSPDIAGDTDLAWLAAENRYFAVVSHLPVPEGATVPADATALEAVYPQTGVAVYPDNPALPNELRGLVFTLGTAPLAVPANGHVDLPLGIFAGPRKSDVLSAGPHALLGLDQLVRYELGCTWCTFQWLARLLLWFLDTIHLVVRDWGVAIIILVLVVRLILHPITKRAQVNMMKMGKQMQALQPEMEKLKKKFGDDQQKLQAETMKLYREKGINPANMLGCLPMFLQMPIWVALYAMLYFAIELRHQPAFYGVFQGIGELFGFYWPFLADLSVADQFIPLPGAGFRIPLPFVQNTINAINLLPILMGVVFYLNMKFTSPPTPEPPEGGKLTEQQEMMARQQKMMRIIFPFMMPIFLYSAPSGLTLYICASTFAGIIDSYIVRRHLKELEAEGKLFEQKPRNPNSLVARLARAAEEKQRQLMERQQQTQGGKRGPQRRR